MIRANVPEHARYKETMRKSKINPDVVKYFGTEVDLDAIPDNESVVEEEKEEEEHYSSDDF